MPRPTVSHDFGSPTDPSRIQPVYDSNLPEIYQPYSPYSFTAAAFDTQSPSQRSSPSPSSIVAQIAPRLANIHDFNERRIGTALDRWSVGTNRHTPPPAAAVQHQSTFNHNYNNRRPYSSPSPLYSKPAFVYQPPINLNDSDTNSRRSSAASSSLPPLSSIPGLPNFDSTLYWGNLEPWMDEEYAKQACTLMGWDPVRIRIPPATVDGATGLQPNNPGYCFLTFPSPAHAASVLNQVTNTGSTNPITMPNSTKPFMFNWASEIRSSDLHPQPPCKPFASIQQPYPKEYSIFVGDLAPETSNSDLVAVFRNPVLGLRNDREPKFIRPFLSCKSAKIMLDPVTGVSRGYGFVRFTDEADQQRALIEMHGLYCLSRPMRISPATAKYKQPSAIPGYDFPQSQVPITLSGISEQVQPITIALPIPSAGQAEGASPSSNAASSTISPASVASSITASTVSVSSSLPSQGSGSSNGHASSLTQEDLLNLPHDVLAQLAQLYANESVNQSKSSSAPAQSLSISTPFAQSEGQDVNAAEPQRYLASEESWKHHAQARAILGNLIGPNGEQLTSTDPYNTTVFVGGLSPLISEETLRTFFAPFGDIHYVKVPVGKHCGFVQFVKKADAERAIEKMQGFPIGGSRIRLSWGRSQYKAAQAAAQAAQAAAMQAHYQSQVASQLAALNPEQALSLFQKAGLLPAPAAGAKPLSSVSTNGVASATVRQLPSPHEEKISTHQPAKGNQSAPAALDPFSVPFSGRTIAEMRFLESQQQNPTMTSFSPFSPEPNLYMSDHPRRDSVSLSHPELLPHSLKNYSHGFGSSTMPPPESNMSSLSSRISPTSTRPSSAAPPRYSAYLESVTAPFQIGRSERPISRPTSCSHSSRLSGGHEQDMLQELNGTLACLDLDKVWKVSLDSPTVAEGATPFKSSNTLSHSLSTP